MNKYNSHTLPHTHKLPPGSMGLPFIGETAVFWRNANFVQSRVKQHGPIFKSSLFGHKIAFMVGPAANEFVLSSHLDRFSACQGYPGTMKRLLGHTALSALDGQAHQQARRTLIPVFNRSAVMRALPLIETIAASYRQQWPRQLPADWHLTFRHLTLDIMTRLLLGGELARPIPELCRWSGKVSGSLSAFLPLHWRWGRYRQACAARDRLLAEITAVLPSSPTHYRLPSQPTALSLLLDQTGSWQDEATRQQLGLQLLFLLFAGHETLSRMLTSLQQALIRHPHVMARAWAEQRPFTPHTHPPTFDQLQQMPYLDQILLEVERLYPTIDGLYRGVRQSFTYNDCTVPVGWLVSYRIRETHQDPQIYQEPHCFDPDRFGPDRAEHKRHRFSLVGFGGGPRVCLGKPLALLTMKVVAVHLLRFYNTDAR